jgi:hypothetical protein
VDSGDNQAATRPEFSLGDAKIPLAFGGILVPYSSVEQKQNKEALMTIPKVPLSERGVRQAERERWLRRQAMQIVVQLPEDETDALQVLDYAKTLVRPL